MWRQVVLPVIVVGVMLFTISAATTYYVQWLEASHQRVLNEDVASTSAATVLQEEMWHFHAELLSPPVGEFQSAKRLDNFHQAIEKQLAILDAASITDEEQGLTRDIHALFKQYCQLLEPLVNPKLPTTDAERAAQQTALYPVAESISEKAARMREINEEMLAAATLRRDRIRNIVFWSRTAAMFLVPTFGIAFGWWTANRLQRSVAEIQVTLHDPALAEPDNLGTVEILAGNELDSIQRQVEYIVSRLRRTSDDLQSARQEVLRAERMAAIGGLAAGVAHELRNPLTSVKLLLQHASSKSGDAVIGTPRIKLILDEIERMEATIQGLVDFSAPTQPQRKLHDLRETLDRTMALVQGRAEKQRVSVEATLGDRPVTVNGDPQQLHQVFMNLLINAIEAMPSGGNMSIRVRENPDNRSVVVCVEDTGAGIPAELLPRLFEPFAAAKERGTGLGLAVSRRILEEHGGTIAARARSPRGTVFEVTLPSVAVPAELVSFG